MVTIFNIEIDLLSLLPGLFAAILSIYNWFQMRKPANIKIGRIVNYGFISSSYENALFFCFPMVFENISPNNGIITEIKIGFQYGGETKYIDTDARVRLNEFSGASMPQMNYEKFTDDGYRILLPTYPIPVEGFSSEKVTIISTVSLEDKILLAGQEGKMIVEVYFGANKVNKTTYDYFLSQESLESDNILIWLKMVDK
ncbi:hypothetical protein NEF87_002553 [Candidatus Lokiarchaeum ossiferum]|uniref:Uncharacterized protein n=1 Tax=Candidatus Lokiarchaeum ossiferum TaxID=2951803 RepID=A0ABY6HRX9_9ARCH|nr:hypothetical protein NEF87_002553 [Candidatus Lokiarchaeum sp. B-35]